MKHLGNYIRTIINQKKIKQTEVAAAIGIRPQVLSRLLNEDSWDMAKYVAISDAIGMNPADFFKEDIDEIDESQEKPKAAYSDAINNGLSNIANIFDGIGKISIAEEQDASFLKSMIAIQAATIENKDAIIREKERIIQILMEGKDNSISSEINESV